MAIEILKEKCTGCGLCFKSCPYDAFEFEPYDGNKLGRVAKVNAKCSFCNQCLTACRFGAIKEVQTATGDDRFKDYKHIWVYAEQRHGKIQNVALELIGEGRKLAKDISEDTQVCAILVGDKIDHLAQECFEYGAEKVYMIQDPLLEQYTTDGYTKVIYDAIQEYKPEIVLYGATHIGRDLAPRIAARCNTGLTDRKSTRLNSSHRLTSRMPSSA